MCIQIMDISRGGYKVANGFIMAAAVDLDDAPTWRSAYDCETGKIFHLYGFQDSNLGFNDLVKSQDLHIKTQSDALVLLSSFISLSYLDSPRAVMRDELDLMGAAIGDFRGVRSQAAFETYWRKCPHRVKSQIAQPSAKALSGGFEIVFFSYAKKQLHKNSIVCHDNGTLNDVVSKELFRW
jgi:hypothetical protein